MSAIPGIIQEIEQPFPAPSGVPSFVEVKQFWTRIQIQADRIEFLFASINAMLKKLANWSRHGVVNPNELAQAIEWVGRHDGILKQIFERYAPTIADEWQSDGSGI